MVIFWGPAVIFIAAVPTIRPSPDSPSPLFFRNLRTMPPWPGSLTRPSPRSPAFPPGCYGVFLPGDCAPLCWAAVPPLCCHVGRSLSWPPICAPSQPWCHVHDCPPHAAVTTRSSPPASLLPRWALVIIFSQHSTLSRQQAVGVLGISSPPCC